MKFTYAISADNFLEYYVYMASESKTITRKRNIAKYSFSFIYLVFATYFIMYDRYDLGAVFIAVSIVWFFLYPLLAKKSLKRFYSKHLLVNYEHRMSGSTEMSISSDAIVFTDKNGSNSILGSECEKILETTNCYFLKLNSGTSFIIPKNQIDILAFTNSIKPIDLTIHQNPKWQWK